MATKWDAEMRERFDKLDERLGTVETRLDSLGDKMDMQFEKLQDDINTLGEGYDQGLKGISRQLKEIGDRWDAKWWPHDLALNDHGKRITALEQRAPK